MVRPRALAPVLRTSAALSPVRRLERPVLRADGPAAEPAVMDDLGNAHDRFSFFSANSPIVTTLFYKIPHFLVKFPCVFCCAFPQKDCRFGARCGILGADGFVFPNHSLKIHSFFQFLH